MQLALLMSLVAVGSAVNVSNAGPCQPTSCKHNSTCANITHATGVNYTCSCLTGWTGAHCETNIDDCGTNITNPCLNGGLCTDQVGGFSCECKYGFKGATCDIPDYFTLQQWKGIECFGPVWRCFKLQMNKCIDTGFIDGNMPTRENWWGKLTYDDSAGIDGKYTIDLCFGVEEDPEDPDSKCTCSNHFANIRRLGKNSLGPRTQDPRDSDECHKMRGLTSTRIVNSTGRGVLVTGSDGEPATNNIWCNESGALRCSPAIAILIAVVFGGAFSYLASV